MSRSARSPEVLESQAHNRGDLLASVLANVGLSSFSGDQAYDFYFPLEPDWQFIPSRILNCCSFEGAGLQPRRLKSAKLAALAAEGRNPVRSCCRMNNMDILQLSYITSRELDSAECIENANPNL